jgi:predicted nucleic acid-binding protein
VILVDLNVLLDVVQKREPHYRASAAVLSEVVNGRVSAILPAHAFTTLFYIVERYQNHAKANEVVDWLLRYFGIAPIGRDELLYARELNWSDFEDAVVAASAEAANCRAIVTRNITDFPDSTVPVLTPHEYLLEIEA